MITTDQIKALREKTGLSVMQCKKALEDASGDEAKAEEFLRVAGAAIAHKKADRELGAGVIGSYIHSTKQVGTILELNCETDFVAKNDAFIALAYDIAMHITASMPADVEAALEQPFIKDPSRSIRQLIEGGTQKFGERIALRRFSRFSTLDS